MTPNSIREYAAAIRERYRRASKADKGAILEEFCLTTQYHRKSAIRLLRNPPSPSKHPRGRQREYGLEVAHLLYAVWKASDYMCSKRLQPFLPELVAVLERHGEIVVPVHVRPQLLQLSPATIDRLLKPFRQRGMRQPHCSSHSSSVLKAQIPIRTFADWDGVRVGYLQMDLVAHCGESTEGFYLQTLDSVDVVSGWCEPIAIWGKQQSRVVSGVDQIRRRVPFPLLGIDVDNGGEFINQGLYNYCHGHHIEFTRGRPYKKNDQAYVEQRNWTVVRRLLGYDRYSTKAAYAQLEEVCSLLRLYFNFFQPIRKLVSKERVDGRVKKRYDVARTPYQRLLAGKVLSEQKVAELGRQYEGLNPVQLRREIDAALEKLWALRDDGPAEQRSM